MKEKIESSNTGLGIKHALTFLLMLGSMLSMFKAQEISNRLAELPGVNFMDHVSLDAMSNMSLRHELFSSMYGWICIMVLLLCATLALVACDTDSNVDEPPAAKTTETGSTENDTEARRKSKRIVYRIANTKGGKSW